MVFELHVWGPAFTLPSIEPQCLAAIAYLTQAVPQGEWVLIASSDTALSPTSSVVTSIEDLPALRDGSIVIGGFHNIVNYLHQKSNGKWQLDDLFSDPTDQADITAFSSHLTIHALTLLDLSLYVSSQNYTTATRPAYTSILPWPTQYIVPPTRRSLAKSRTDHLGLSSLDLDTIDDEDREKGKASNIIPEALRSATKRTVTGLVKQSQGGMRFRLDALVDALCEPLDHLLGKKKYFISDQQPSSLDCLVLGYLSLAVLPDLPMKWLRERMQAKWPRLVHFVNNGVEAWYGGETEPQAALPLSPDEPNNSNAHLPWQPPNLQGAKLAEKIVWSQLTERLPLPRSTTFLAPDTKAAAHHHHDASPHSPSALLLPTLITAGTALAAVAGYGFYVGFGGEREKTRLADLGAAGQIFEGVDFGEDGG